MRAVRLPVSSPPAVAHPKPVEAAVPRPCSLPAPSSHSRQLSAKRLPGPQRTLPALGNSKTACATRLSLLE
eukprot:605259-Amphidinium_carterae.1